MTKGAPPPLYISNVQLSFINDEWIYFLNTIGPSHIKIIYTSLWPYFISLFFHVFPIIYSSVFRTSCGICPLFEERADFVWSVKSQESYQINLRATRSSLSRTSANMKRLGLGCEMWWICLTTGFVHMGHLGWLLGSCFSFVMNGCNLASETQHCHQRYCATKRHGIVFWLWSYLIAYAWGRNVPPTKLCFTHDLTCVPGVWRCVCLRSAPCRFPGRLSKGRVCAGGNQFSFAELLAAWGRNVSCLSDAFGCME